MRRLIYSISMKVRVVVKILSLVFTSFKSSKPGIYFLMYHSVGEKIDLEIDVAKNLFEKQMKFVKARGAVISIDEASRLLKTNANLDQYYFVITFDDGYKNFFTNAYPILKREKIPAILYLNTSYMEFPSLVPIDNRVGFSSPIEPLSWGDAKFLTNDDLITIGCHCHLHEELIGLSDEAIHEDIRLCLAIIKDNLKIQPIHFCYPRGVYNDRVINCIRPFFRTAVTTVFNGKPVEAIQNNYSIKRIPVLKSDGLFWFKLRITGKLYLDILLLNFISRKILR